MRTREPYDRQIIWVWGIHMRKKRQHFPSDYGSKSWVHMLLFVGTTLKRNEAESTMISASLYLVASAEQKRDKLLHEVHTSLNILTMLKHLGTKAQIWVEGVIQSEPLFDSDLRPSLYAPDAICLGGISPYIHATD